ncbi:MAG TPA: hypothetical protein VGY55_23920 [Pirellulales bacterium]|nr:hypothetical protein [Pirellulales bacterium]
MLEALLELIALVILAIVAEWLGISFEAAKFILGTGIILIGLWVCFRSALRDAQRRQRRTR